jgi:hypothetical protein
MKDVVWEFKHTVLGVEVSLFDLIVISINCILLSFAAFFFILNWVSPAELEAESPEASSEDLISSSFKPQSGVKQKPLPKLSTQSKPRRGNQSKRS